MDVFKFIQQDADVHVCDTLSSYMKSTVGVPR